jgi:Pyridine nucleotide-disulphide oxidoreductase
LTSIIWIAVAGSLRRRFSQVNYSRDCLIQTSKRNYRMDCHDPGKRAFSKPGHSVHDPQARRVLILGGGFGGIYAALRLERLRARHRDLEVTLVTRDNYFLFTPMLPEVASGELEQKHNRQSLTPTP